MGMSQIVALHSHNTDWDLLGKQMLTPCTSKIGTSQGKFNA